MTVCCHCLYNRYNSTNKIKKLSPIFESFKIRSFKINIFLFSLSDYDNGCKPTIVSSGTE